jgi:Spy/CpxP family protein refolding chaperone
MSRTTLAIALTFGLTSLTRAQTQAPTCVVDGVRAPCERPAPPAGDPFARYFFPPELVMSHQQEIGLTDRQRSAIQEAMKDAQGKFIDAQFKMSAEAEKLQRLLQGSSVDEAKVLEQVDRVLTLERDVKHVQVSLMIRIKNQLTAEQQLMLTTRRKLGELDESVTRQPER